MSLPAAAQRADVGGDAAGISINHSHTLLQRLQDLLRQGNASDVVLRVQAVGTDEVRAFHTHRLLLGLHSELFREMLSNRSEVVLQEPRDCAAVFDKFIRYTGGRAPCSILSVAAQPLHFQGRRSLALRIIISTFESPSMTTQASFIPPSAALSIVACVPSCPLGVPF